MVLDTNSLPTPCPEILTKPFQFCDKVVGEKNNNIDRLKNNDQKENSTPNTTDDNEIDKDIGEKPNPNIGEDNSSFKANLINGNNITSTQTSSSNADNASEMYVPRLRWPDLIAQTFLHVGFLYGIYLVITAARFYTAIFAFATVYITAFGITAGVHRLWSHRSYKAKWPLRVILMLLFTVTGQRDLYTWALDHRVHHKYTETDSDPHDSRRGFFFSHVGWLFLTPHPDVVAKRKTVDVRDLEADAIVMWQKRWFIPLFALLSIYLPVMIPVWFWQETIWNSFWINFNCRFTFTLNMAFAVNSFAHMFGDKPYDKNISPTDNLAVAVATFGEGWHNYHHVFPWDYKTGELGLFNPSTAFIDFCAKYGLAYDRKSVSPQMIARRAVRSGDGSYLIDHHNMKGPALWGYGDEDTPEAEKDDLEKMKDKLE